MAKKTPQPGRTLLIFVLVIGVLYGLAALAGTWKPRLGLDLEGGTRITLVADNTPSATKLRQAANIIDARVNGSGVSESAVSTQGGQNIIVEIPGKNRGDLLDAVKRTAQLRFRLVAYCPQITGSVCQASGRPQSQSSSSPSPSTSSSPSGSAKPSAKPGASSASSTPKPRPAPMVDRPAASPKPKPTGSAKATPTPTPSATPQTPKTTKGAPVNDPMPWTKNPGTDWQLKFAAAKCDKDGVAMVPVDSKHLGKLTPSVDDPKQPMVACDSSGNKSLLSTAIINGVDLKSASYGQDSKSLAGWVVNLSFKSDAAKTFAQVSQALSQGASGPYAGGLFAIVLDGKVLKTPGFNEPILDGNAQITGGFSESGARSLANSLKYGALPVKFKADPSVEVIGPSLAGNQLTAGILAGIVGLLIVMIYCLFYYRGLGLVVIASLLIAAAVTYAIVLLLAKSAGFTLTLPGIAGLIVAVGITADSFIVYFERIRDEMREGRSMRVAVEAGWARARNTCLAADGVSFLAAIVLYTFAIGVVRGFAFALGVSTIIDILVFFFFTKPVMTLLARRTFFNSGSKYSGLSRETLGVDGDPRLVGGRL